MRNSILIVALLLAGCKVPATPPTPTLTAPTISGVYMPPAAVASYPATPTTVWLSKTTYGVMLCYAENANEFLCWPPPVGPATVGP